MDNSGSRHGRTLSVPSISAPHSPSPSPSLSVENLPNNSFYLSASADASGGLSWGSSSSGGLRSGSVASARSRSASTSSLTSPIAGQGVTKRKVVTACQRCRTRKIKCDGILPSCGSCSKAGAACLEVDKSGERDMPRRCVSEISLF